VALILHLLLLRLARQRLDEVEVQGGVDTSALVLQPQLLAVLLDDVLHQGRFEHYLLLPGFGGGQAQFDFVLGEKLLQLFAFYLPPDELLLGD